MTATKRIACPFIYADGRRCSGHIVQIEAFKADLCWSMEDGESWSFDWDRPRSHFHLTCSDKGNHAGYRRQDDDQMKLHYRDLPSQLQAIVAQRLLLANRGE